jgi:hypothetical protein
MAEGAERILEMLLDSELPDEAWLRSLATFGELNVRPGTRNRGAAHNPTVIAVVLLQPE